MNVLDVFRSFQTVFGVCPCCGELFRLSDAQVFLGQPARRTVFDSLDDEQWEVDIATERFDAREDRIREKALERGRAAARRRLRKIAPVFAAHHIDPNDVKVIFDAVEYVAFCGLNRDAGCSRIRFVGRIPSARAAERRLKSLDRTLERGNVEWHEYRVLDDGTIAVDDD